MSRRKKTPVQSALIDLRERLQMTQQQLAQALSVSTVSVCRWETSRPPTGLSLQTLARFAEESRALEEAAILQDALNDEQRPYLKLPIAPDEEALRELRRGANFFPGIRRAYLDVLHKLRDAHEGLLRDALRVEREGLEHELLDNTQKNLEWMVKNYEKQTTTER
jgi:transcriptional regulator with XRE-family HTH domain